MKIEVALWRSLPHLVEEVVDPSDPLNPYSRDWERFRFPDEYLDTAAAGVPWSTRPSVTLEVDPLWSISDALAEAADALGVTWTERAESLYGAAGGGFALRLEGIYFAAGDRDVTQLTMIVDGFGRATCNFFPDEVRLVEVLATKEQALFDGDPARLVLRLDPHLGRIEGGNGFSLWSNVFEIYTNLKPWLEAEGLIAGAVAGTVAAAQATTWVWRRYAPSLEHRSIGIEQVDTLARMAASPQQLAHTLGVRESEAASILVTLGLMDDPGGNSEADRHFRRFVVLTAKVSTHFYLSPDYFEAAVKQSLLLPFDDDENALEEKVRSIFLELRQQETERYK